VSVKKISRVLVANRGEIALRIINTCNTLGIETVLVVSTADCESLPTKFATRCVVIGPPEASRSYLHIPALIAAAVGTQCDALHPGYGFLAESAELASACDEYAITFIGPTSSQIEQMGNKLRARDLARSAGVPLLTGSNQVFDTEEAILTARQIGFPVMLKAAAGGGGRGMKIANDEGAISTAFLAASNEARSAFGDPAIYIERYVAKARHVEVQVVGDGRGKVLHFWERDCSTQRRHQKLIEEAPAPNLSTLVRENICRTAVAFAQQMNYRGAGTVEFLFDAHTESYFFLEMNTRIQVEHPVTEMVTGFDLVELQIRVASGVEIGLKQEDIKVSGHAIECRVNAEDTERNFSPCPGTIEEWNIAVNPNVRLDSHCYPGYVVPPYYDSMVGKLIARGETRDEAIELMRRTLNDSLVTGIKTTIPFLKRVLEDSEFSSGDVSTGLVGRLGEA